LTKKLYWEQPYLQEFTAQVVGSEGTRVELDQTLFYPKGGGVSCDTGVLGGKRVIETSKDGDTILHNLETASIFSLGQTVNGKIDWDRRHRLMRMHTAGHLLSALLYSGAKSLITGNQIDVEKSRMDFSLEIFYRTQIERFVNEANKLIAKDAPVKSYFLDRNEALKIPDMVKLAEAAPPVEAQLRIVEIAGIDRQADGGLHVAQLKEIGRIELLKLENKGKTNRRLYYDVATA
jgi:misacylated tRNA(Ala) deacylase